MVRWTQEQLNSGVMNRQQPMSTLYRQTTLIGKLDVYLRRRTTTLGLLQLFHPQLSLLAATPGYLRPLSAFLRLLTATHGNSSLFYGYLRLFAVSHGYSRLLRDFSRQLTSTQGKYDPQSTLMKHRQSLITNTRFSYRQTNKQLHPFNNRICLPLINLSLIYFHHG